MKKTLATLRETHMNTKALSSAVRCSLLVTALASAAVLTGTARADEAASNQWGHPAEGFVCSKETLRGIYGFIVTGVRPTMPGGPQVSIVGTALTTFHGDGTFDQFDNINVNSTEVPFQPDRPGSGTYELKPDCSGTMSLTAGGVTLELRITVVDHGREVLTAVVTPHVIVTSDGKKI
jgi:hypothetical protein